MAIALKCLNAAFIQRREHSAVRIAAFFKQICTVCLHLSATITAPLLAFTRQLIQRYPSIHQLLENEQDVITSGRYTPDVGDPEHVNPFATVGWELAALKFHMHPAVNTQAVGAASQKMLQLPAETPDRILSDMMSDAAELYIPSKRVKKQHPLAQKHQDSKRQQPRFITPRDTSNQRLV
mmetsp:Transcript_19409/g.45159  ORF Transcript_19409/g.45159 Transcript_19409/m.45159 type:complete len:180 (-) Transcript_19409:624-1163(-)